MNTELHLYVPDPPQICPTCGLADHCVCYKCPCGAFISWDTVCMVGEICSKCMWKLGEEYLEMQNAERYLPC